MYKAEWTVRIGVVGVFIMVGKLAIPAAVADSDGSQTSVGTEERIPGVTVMARKIAENVQDVPIVVTALSGQRLYDAGVKDIKDLSILVPGLNVTSTSSESVTTARIRGIGTVGDNPGLESSVGVMIDGVYRPRNGVGFGDLGELERIEVLKGPQGTLFGKNTSAGVINILTPRPEFRFGAHVDLTSGNFSAEEGSFSLTGPIVGNTVAGRFYVARSQRDGFYQVHVGNGPRTRQSDTDRDINMVRAQLLFVPNDAIDVRLIGDYARHAESCCVAVQTNAGATEPIINALAPGGGLARQANPFARQAFANRPTPQNIQDRGVSVELNWKPPTLNNATLTSISAWRDWDFVGGIDADYSAADLLYRSSDGRYGNQFKQVSEELRLAGQTQRLNWLIGTFYGLETLDSRYQLAYGSAFEPYYSLLFSQGTAPTLVSSITGLAPGSAYPFGAGLNDRFSQTSDSYAFFTNNTLSLTKGIDATVGLRYTDERKKLESRYSNYGGGSTGCAASRGRSGVINAVFAGAPLGTAASWYNFGCGTFADPAFDNFASRQTTDEAELSGTAKLAFRLSNQFMSYVSYARGHKAGGFNLDRVRIANPALGAADPAAHAASDTSFASEIADSYEIGVKSRWMESRFILNGALFHQELKNFQLNTFTGVDFIVASVPKVKSRGADLDFQWYTPLSGLALAGGMTFAETSYGDFTANPGVSSRLPGNQVSFAPKWSGVLSATYSRPININFLWHATVSAKSTSSFNTGSDLDPAKEQSGFTLLNARLAVGGNSGRWIIEAWGLNVTDRQYYQVVIDAPLQPGTFDAFLGAPRTFGVTVRSKF